MTSGGVFFFFYTGGLDDVFIYNRTLTAQEIQSLYKFDIPTGQPTSQPSRQPSSQPSAQPSTQPTTQPTVRISSSLKNGLVAFYPFDGNAHDNSGNGNHGVVHGGVSLVADRFGNPKNAMQFDGSSGYIEIPGNQFNFAFDMSISIWVKPASVQGIYAALLDKSLYGNSAGWRIQQNGNSVNEYVFAYVVSQSFISPCNSPSLISDIWNHFVITKKNTTTNIYLNNILAISGNATAGPLGSNHDLPLILGAYNTALTRPASGLSRFFNGVLDDVIFFNRSLTNTEVQLLYSFDSPTSQPSMQPTTQPTRQPTSQPTHQPSSQPTSSPTMKFANCLFGFPQIPNHLSPGNCLISNNHQYRFCLTKAGETCVYHANDPLNAVYCLLSTIANPLGFFLQSDRNLCTESKTPNSGGCTYTQTPYYGNYFLILQDSGCLTLVNSSSVFWHKPVPFLNCSNSLTSTCNNFPTSQPSRQPTAQPTRQPTSHPSSQPTTRPTVRISSALKNGLVAYYPFDGDVHDNSGNGNHGIVVGTASLTDDRFGNVKNAYQLNNNAGYIYIPSGSSFNFMQTMSLCFWLKPSATQGGNYAVIFDKTHSPGYFLGEWAFMQDTRTNYFQFVFIDTSLTWHNTTAFYISPSFWTHVAVVKGVNFLTMSINGILRYSATTSTLPMLTNGNYPLTIGTANAQKTIIPTACCGYFGLIDDIFIFNRTLTSSDIQQLYQFDTPTSQPSTQPTTQPTRQPTHLPSRRPSAKPSKQPTSQPSKQPTSQPTSYISGTLTQGLVAYYPFDGNARDQSGNGNSGEVHNATLTNDRFGNPNSAYRFDGSSSYIKISNGLPFDFSNHFSVAFWIKPTAIPNGYAAIISKNYRASGKSSWFIEQNASGIEQNGNSLNSLVLYYVQSVSDNEGGGHGISNIGNQWNQYSVTKENTKLSTYFNGNLISTVGSSTPSVFSAIKTNGDLPLFVGAFDTSSGSHFDGILDDIFIYNRTLTAQEVLKLYQFGAPTSQPTGSPTSQPSVQPSIQPTSFPSNQPTSPPSLQPVGQPTDHPFNEPTSQPTKCPSSQPTRKSSTHPTVQPSVQPSCVPTTRPSGKPSSTPSSYPSDQPTSLPTQIPSKQPSGRPTSTPSILPISQPSALPSTQPSAVPTGQPSQLPTSMPSSQPTLQPTGIPSVLPSSCPFSQPTRVPTSQPSSFPSQQPSSCPSSQPTSLPSYYPTCTPTLDPTVTPTNFPSSQPSSVPSLSPSIQPSPFPTTKPSRQPSNQPSSKPSFIPFSVPSIQPTSIPSAQPSYYPTNFPTARPSSQPSCKPTSQPSRSPSSQPTSSPITSSPTSIPTIITESPTPLRVPSISAYPSQTRKPTRQPITPRPTAIPTVRPSYIPTSAPTQKISVFPSHTEFKESLFFFGSYLPAVENVPSIYLNVGTIGSSCIIFGFHKKERIPKEIVIGSRNSQGLYTPIMYEAGLRQDHTMSRTALPIGDFNGDTYTDILICDPINSLCFVYFGHVNGLQNLQVSFAIKSNNNDIFGWSVAKLNDMNKDNCNDIAISALSSNVIFVFFGSENTADILIDQLDSSVGIQIIGSQNDRNSGLALNSAGDFNNDGDSDVLFSAIQINPYQNVIYILFLNPDIIKQDIIIDNLEANKGYFKITAPLFSFAGFSLSNLGDINQDGFDDIIIGSIPYSGRYLTQKSYVIYGRNSLGKLTLSEITEKDGFTIIGGGFMVGGPGDVNNDGIPDIMISSYQQWQGKGNSYIMVYPRNVTSPPTFLPSSQPSSFPSSSPTSSPSFRVHDPTSTPTFQVTTNEPVSEGTFPPFLEATQLPSLAPKTSIPTRIPSIKSITHSPTIKTDLPSVSPTRNPTENPTRRPTTLPSSKVPSRFPTERRVASRFPTSYPSMSPTVSLSSGFQEVIIDKEGIYNALSGKMNCIISGEGEFEITGNGGGKKIYTILPSKNAITITDFNKKYDQISLIHFPYLYSINDLVYRTNPLQIFLSNEQKLILSSLGASDLAEDNFIFQRDNEDQNMNSDQPSFASMISVGVLASCVGLIGFLVKMNQMEDTYPWKDTLQDTDAVIVTDTNDNGAQLESPNEKLSSKFSSVLTSSSESGSESDDSDNVNSSKEEKELSENDWNIFSSLNSFFSSDNDSVEVVEDKMESVGDVFNVVDPEEEQEEQSFVFTESDDQQETSDGSIDIEGNYKNSDGDDMESFNNSY
jgi:hypothetical protein